MIQTEGVIQLFTKMQTDYIIKKNGQTFYNIPNKNDAPRRKDVSDEEDEMPNAWQKFGLNQQKNSEKKAKYQTESTGNVAGNEFYFNYLIVD